MPECTKHHQAPSPCPWCRIEELEAKISEAQEALAPYMFQSSHFMKDKCVDGALIALYDDVTNLIEEASDAPR